MVLAPSVTLVMLPGLAHLRLSALANREKSGIACVLARAAAANLVRYAGRCLFFSKCFPTRYNLSEIVHDLIRKKRSHRESVTLSRRNEDGQVIS
jgi:hypothetical protein